MSLPGTAKDSSKPKVTRTTMGILNESPKSSVSERGLGGWEGDKKRWKAGGVK